MKNQVHTFLKYDSALHSAALRRKWRRKIMKKRILATVMTLTLGAAMLTACGSGADETPVESAVVEETNNIEPTTEAADVTATTEEAADDTATTEEAADDTTTTEEAADVTTTTEEAADDTATTETADADATEEAATETATAQAAN